jgi:hypothetical protein
MKILYYPNNAVLKIKIIRHNYLIYRLPGIRKAQSSSAVSLITTAL